jgi:hypothetical protein
MRDYDAWADRLATSDTFRRVFGSWGKALQVAGFRVVRGQKLDPYQMVEVFKACWRKSQSVPSYRQLEDFLERDNSPFRAKSYLVFFGGLGRLAQLIVKVQNGEMPESKLLERYKPERRLSRTLPLRLRSVILKRDGHRCVKCGVDSKGGDNKLENLRTLCDKCNLGRGNREEL